MYSDDRPSQWLRRAIELQKAYAPQDISFDPKRLERLSPAEACNLIDRCAQCITEHYKNLDDTLRDMALIADGVCLDKKTLFTTAKATAEKWKTKKKDSAVSLALLIYELIETALAFGIDIDELMRRVHRSQLEYYPTDDAPPHDDWHSPVYLDDLL